MDIENLRVAQGGSMAQFTNGKIEDHRNKTFGFPES